MRPDFGSRAVLRALYVAFLLFMPVRAAAQADGPPPLPLDSATIEEIGSRMRVYLMTAAPGTEIWEKFGHDALWFQDTVSGRSISYNYGIFDDNDPKFIVNFLRGRMEYSMGDYPWDTAYDMARYAGADRTMYVQELNLTPRQRVELQYFLDWNDDPEHTKYRYDYFRDNCATRIRDAINRVTDGQLERSLQSRDAGTTYRWQARRMLADEQLAYAGIELAMGGSVDRELTAWEDAFLPMQLMEHIKTVNVRMPDGSTAPLVKSSGLAYETKARPAPLATPPDRTLLYLMISCVVGVLLIVLARMATKRASRSARVLYTALASAWSLLVGFFGTVALLLWLVTDHAVTYRNENILQANPLSLVLAVLVVMVFLGRSRRGALKLSLVIAGLALFGFVMQILPGLDQMNRETIALLLPAHLALAASLRDFNRSFVSTRSDSSPSPA